MSLLKWAVFRLEDLPPISMETSQIKPIPPGKVDLKASFVGYKPFMYRGIVIMPDKITFQDLELETSTTTLDEIEVVDYKVPLISKDQTTSGGTVTSDEISKMANKSASLSLLR